MLHLFDQAQKQKHNDGYHKLWQEKRNPTADIRINIGRLEQYPTANQINDKKQKFESQHAKDELQCAFIVRFHTYLL